MAHFAGYFRSPDLQCLKCRQPVPRIPAPRCHHTQENVITMKAGKLRNLLEEMNSDASDWIQTHAGLLGAAYPGNLPAIREALEDFDFDVATAQLDAATSNRVPAS